MRSKVVLMVAVCLAIPIGFAVAHGQSEKSTTSSGPVKLVFRQNDPPNVVKGLMAEISSYNQSQSAIHVQAETVPWSNAENQFIREAQAGGGPDVLQLAFVWTKDLASSGLIDNLEPFIKSSPPGNGISDFLGTDLGVYKGAVYGIPWTVDTFAMAYRPDLFQKAGVSSFPNTWQQLYETAKKLTVVGSNGNTTQYGFGFPAGSGATAGMWFLANYYLWSNGKTFVEKDSNGKWKLGVDAQEVAQAMEYFNRFFTTGVSPKSLISVNSWADPVLVGGLARGEFAITFSNPQTFAASEKQSSVPLETAMDPKGSVKRISHLGGRTLAINADTKYPQQSWTLLKYLISGPIFKSYNQYPAQRSLLKALTFPKPEMGFVDQLQHAITFKQYIDSPAPVSGMWAATNQAFGAVFSGQKTPNQAAKDLLNKIQGLLNSGS